MQRYKSLDDFQFKKERKKCIIIEDSFIKYLGFFDKKSYILNPKDPLRKDDTIIDYDMSSEEEWNEQNGEDVDGKNQDEEEDDEIENMLKEDGDEEEEGFIVPDDYLSASELNLT